METSAPSTTAAPSPRLPDDVRLGAVHLDVADVGRVADFYASSIGLHPLERSPGGARLGVPGRELVVLHHQPSGRRAHRAAGLFHMALLFPDRASLADAVMRLVRTRTPVEGASDHGVSEAIYLPDPEGNGIELYVDRPRSAWPAPGAEGERVGMVTAALDLDDLIAQASPGGPGEHASPGLVMGHVHLHVGDLRVAEAFFRDVVGMDLMQRYPGAIFMSAGGYHHHVGLNTWRGTGVTAPPPGSLGVRHWTLRIARDDARAALVERLRAAGSAPEATGAGHLVRDPLGNRVHVTA